MNDYPAFPCPALPYVPHGEPMSLLDDILAFEGDRVEARVTIRPDSMFFADGGVPNWVGMEYMAQTIGASAGLRSRAAGGEVKLGFLVSVRRVEFACDQYAEGDCLQVSATEVVMAANGLATFDCAITRDEETLAQARINVFQPEDAQAFLAGGANA